MRFLRAQQKREHAVCASCHEPLTLHSRAIRTQDGDIHAEPGDDCFERYALAVLELPATARYLNLRGFALLALDAREVTIYN
jgi:hypothetical protein